MQSITRRTSHLGASQFSVKFIYAVTVKLDFNIYIYISLSRFSHIFEKHFSQLSMPCE